MVEPLPSRTSFGVRSFRLAALLVTAALCVFVLWPLSGCGHSSPSGSGAPEGTDTASSAEASSATASPAPPASAATVGTATTSAATGAPIPPEQHWADGLLHGVVTGTGRALAGARVRVRRGAAPEATDPTDSRADGSFTLNIAPPSREGATKITIGAPGFRSRSFDLPESRESTAYFDMEPLSADRADYAYRSATKGSESCAACHKSQVAAWSASRHASAAGDPIFLDENRIHMAWWQKIDPATASDAAIHGGPFLPADQKGDTGKKFREGGKTFVVLGDDSTATECVKCHSPGYALSGGVDVRPQALAAAAPVFGEGVSCDPCHKVVAVKAATIEDLVMEGFDKAALGRPLAAAPVTEGPFDDVVSADMPASWSPQMGTSEFCATCHSDARVVHLQVLDAQGKPAGDPDVRDVWGEDTFREWRFKPPSLFSVSPIGRRTFTYNATGDGPFTKSDNYAGRPLACQDCHMQDPPPDPATHERIADYRDPARGETTIAAHHDAIARDPRTIHPHRMEGRTRRFLEWATDLSATAARSDKEIEVRVTIENRHTGHAIPTGLPDRNMILLVEATDGSGILQQMSGPQVPGWGSGDRKTDPSRDFAGRAGQGYARFLVDVDGKGPVHYLRAVRANGPDTRIRAGGVDRLVFRFAAQRGPAKVRVRLLHRLRFKAQSDAYLKRHPGEDPTQFETQGDALTLQVK